VPCRAHLPHSRRHGKSLEGTRRLLHRTSRPLLLKDVQSCWHRHGSSSLQDAVRTGASAFTAEEFYAQRAQVSDRIERVLGVLTAGHSPFALEAVKLCRPCSCPIQSVGRLSCRRCWCRRTHTAPSRTCR
jgi:hypothetical protein